MTRAGRGTVWALAAVPKQSVPWIKERVRPVPDDPKRLGQLIAELDAVQFAVREKATVELEKLGDAAEAALRKALAGRPSAEVERRAKLLLEKLRGPVTAPDRLRNLRAIEALEHAGTPEARERPAVGPIEVVTWMVASRVIDETGGRTIVSARATESRT